MKYRTLKYSYLVVPEIRAGELKSTPHNMLFDVHAHIHMHAFAQTQKHTHTKSVKKNLNPLNPNRMGLLKIQERKKKNTCNQTKLSDIIAISRKRRECLVLYLLQWTSLRSSVPVYSFMFLPLYYAISIDKLLKKMSSV